MNNQALAVRQEVGDRTEKAVTLNNIASILEAQSQPELAIIFYKQSVNIICPTTYFGNEVGEES
jgi:hypothetical protein